MKIDQMTINYVTTPIGYNLENPVLRYQLSEQSHQPLYHALTISLDAQFDSIVSVYPKEQIVSYCFYPEIKLKSRQRYYWRVTVWDEQGNRVENESWFETGKMNEPWQAQWLTSNQQEDPAIQMCQTYQLTKPVTNARLYIAGLGVYEAYINHRKIGDEFLTPGYNNYHEWIQYQTYDVTPQMDDDTINLQVILGNGWYKGNFGFHGGQENIYGSQFLLIAELHVDYTDGTTDVLGTNEDWQVSASAIEENGIYYGEDVDLSKESDSLVSVQVVDGPTEKLTERLSVPICVQEERQVTQVQQTKDNAYILDFGQNMVGWVKVFNQLPKGQKMTMEFAETLVDGEFYRENLRAARAAFTFVSDGKQEWLRPHFTFFGFRYVRITGWPEAIAFDPSSFVGQVLYSSLPVTGNFETSNEKVNRLFQNILWSQKGNFVDVPMDCPQRDERMGWTGDAQIFSQTALLNMGVYPFFRKYLHDMATEQPRFDGAPPMTVPHVPSDLSSSPAAVGVWGDAATIIPWNMYRYFGEKQILVEQYESMKAWVAYIQRKAHIRGLWDKQFQFGDWLALDGDDPESPIGGTEAKFVANVFYWYSLTIMAQTAHILGHSADEQTFSVQQQALRQAIRDEYFTPNGRLSMDTQTGYVLALHFKLFEKGQENILVEKLQERLAKDNYHLKTGFVGTPFLNLVLSKYRLVDIAYTLLLNDDYPSWLYAVEMGATTIWERWNAILPDGTMNPLGMNSLNHYAYGAIGQWFYEGVLGIHQNEDSIGYQSVTISPAVHWSLAKAQGAIETPLGTLAISWQFIDGDVVRLEVDIPFLMQAVLDIPQVEVRGADRQTVYQQPIQLSSGNHSYFIYLSGNKKPILSDQLTLKGILDQPLLTVHARNTFAQTRLFSSSNLRDHKKQPLSFFVDKNMITQEQLAHFLQKITQITEDAR
ncbi:alfa-L-rhamnosidase [Enterococcus casseliflavus]|nr:alfa-L-rhamnosidase [Enterococcus casseliflavus]